MVGDIVHWDWSGAVRDGRAARREGGAAASHAWGDVSERYRDESQTMTGTCAASSVIESSRASRHAYASSPWRRRKYMM